jgi:hypothetical protein
MLIEGCQRYEWKVLWRTLGPVPAFSRFYGLPQAFFVQYLRTLAQGHTESLHNTNRASGKKKNNNNN